MLAHTRTVFDQDLTDLARLVGEMGTLVEGQIDRIATAFADDRFALLQDAVQTDETVDKLCTADNHDRTPIPVLINTLSARHLRQCKTAKKLPNGAAPLHRL